MKSVALGDLMMNRGGSVNPALFADELFELYSIPAHDRGGAELLHGREIGSSKQCVEPGDVMISKIIPHIRRARVVAKLDGSRQIASGEWIVFRGRGYDPNYLKHFLLSDQFHVQYMATVAGVGGSLVRARPEQVKSIRVPLPSLDEQRRIAAILDQADALRAKRRQVLARLDTLIQAIFQDMFGNEGAAIELGDVCMRITDGTHQPPGWASSGIPFLFVSNISSGEIDFNTQKYISETTWRELTRRSPIEVGDVLYSTVGSYGIPAVVRTTDRFSFQRHIAHIKPDSHRILPDFLAAQLASAGLVRQAKKAARGIAQPTVNLGDIRKFLVAVPALPAQREFVTKTENTIARRLQFQDAAKANDDLFVSLQSRAFRGEL